MTPSRTQNTALELKPTAQVRSPHVDRGPLLHEPVVAVSLVLIAAAFGQFAVWFVSARIIAPEVEQVGSSVPSSLLANPVLYSSMQQLASKATFGDMSPSRLHFGVCLVLAMLSTVGWYAAVRGMLGAGWALWTAMLWPLHPLFAFPAQRPGGLVMPLLLVPVTWAMLVWWSRSRRRRLAFAAGLSAGVTLLATVGMGLAIMLATPFLLAANHWRRKSWQGFMLLWLGFVLPLIVAAVLVQMGVVPNPLSAFADSLLSSLETAGGSPIAGYVRDHASAEQSSAADRIALVWEAIRTLPAETAEWFNNRLWLAIYATSDGHFVRPLFVAQLLILVPGAWGAIVAIRQQPWRWRAAAGVTFILFAWLAVALVDPLARSLAPVGGMAVMFAVLGMADVYERAFGRRLAAPDIS